MHQRHWKSGWMTVLVVTGLASLSLAQDMPAARGARSGRGAFGFAATLEHRVGRRREQGIIAKHQKAMAPRQHNGRRPNNQENGGVGSQEVEHRVMD